MIEAMVIDCTQGLAVCPESLVRDKLFYHKNKYKQGTYTVTSNQQGEKKSRRVVFCVFLRTTRIHLHLEPTSPLATGYGIRVQSKPSHLSSSPPTSI
jgi:hypothetical protein